MTFARTKIQAPRPRASFVERGVAQRHLAEALASRRVVLVCAPAGYGKTTMVAREVAKLPPDHAVAWISADEGDDLPRLLECMLAALEPFDPPWRIAPEALVQRVGRGTAEDSRDAAIELINTLDACEAARGVIVLDDLHRIHDPPFFRFLEHLVERLGDRWCMVISSRAEPPMALARLRATGELAEFTQLQLQLARDEARRLAATEGMDEATADRVFDRTHGWPAGIRMALGALRAVQAGSGAAAGSVDRALRAGEKPMVDFLASEVLDQLPGDLREFLLRSSVLAELDDERCAAVTGHPDAPAMLDEIERRGLFVDVLEAPVRTLRLHDLFRDALQARLRRQDPAALAQARRRAAATEPDFVRRVALLLEAGDAPAAAREVYRHLPPLLATYGPNSAANLFAQFPPAERERLPELAFVRALVAWIHWDFPGMRAECERSATGFAARGDVEGERRARTYRAIAYISLGEVKEADALLAPLRTAELADETRITLLNVECWLAIDTRRPAAVAGYLTDMLDLLERYPERVDLWWHTSPPNRIAGLPGIWRPLLRHAELLARVGGDDPTPLKPLATLVHAWAAAWQGRLAESRALAERARREADWSGNTGAVRGNELLLTAVAAAMAEDREAAMQAVRTRAGALRTRQTPWGRYLLLLMVARVATAVEKAPALRQALQDLQAAYVGAEPVEGLPEHLPMHGQLAWLEGRRDAAVALWRRALAHESGIDVLGQAMELRTRLAWALAQAGELREAAALLAPVFARARDDGGPGGALLARSAVVALGAVAWGSALPREDVAALQAWCTGCPEAAVAPRAEGLTARELEVLRRIAAGESNKLIARGLDLSLHTVKRHVANILGKLGVETRGQAAAWMRERLPA